MQAGRRCKIHPDRVARCSAAGQPDASTFVDHVSGFNEARPFKRCVDLFRHRIAFPSSEQPPKQKAQRAARRRPTIRSSGCACLLQLQSEPRILSILKPCLFPSLGVSPAEAGQVIYASALNSMFSKSAWMPASSTARRMVCLSASLLSTLSTGIRAPIQEQRRFVQASDAVQVGPV